MRENKVSIDIDLCDVSICIILCLYVQCLTCYDVLHDDIDVLSYQF